MTEKKYRVHDLVKFNYSEIGEYIGEDYTDKPLRNDEIVDLLNEQYETIQSLISDSEKYRKLSIQFDNRNKELVSENALLEKENEQLKQSVSEWQKSSAYWSKTHSELEKENEQLKSELENCKECLELNRESCARHMKENERLKSELRGMEELLKSYRKTIKHDAELLADATKNGYLPPLEDWKGDV